MDKVKNARKEEISQALKEAFDSFAKKDPNEYWQNVSKVVFTHGYGSQQEAESLTDKVDSSIRRSFGEV
jgi:hypothetical protein